MFTCSFSVCHQSSEIESEKLFKSRITRSKLRWNVIAFLLLHQRSLLVVNEKPSKATEYDFIYIYKNLHFRILAYVISTWVDCFVLDVVICSFRKSERPQTSITTGGFIQIRPPSHTWTRIWKWNKGFVIKFSSHFFYSGIALWISGFSAPKTEK